jgi:hypothetical protein
MSGAGEGEAVLCAEPFCFVFFLASSLEGVPVASLASGDVFRFLPCAPGGAGWDVLGLGGWSADDDEVAVDTGVPGAERLGVGDAVDCFRFLLGVPFGTPGRGADPVGVPSRCDCEGAGLPPRAETGLLPRTEAPGDPPRTEPFSGD